MSAICLYLYVKDNSFSTSIYEVGIDIKALKNEEKEHQKHSIKPVPSI